MAENVLSLQTLTEHPTVLIDGHPYALLSPDALPAAGYLKFRRLAVRLDALWQANEDLNDAESTEMGSILQSICRVMLDAPAEVHEKLTDIQRFRVYEAFLKLPRPEAQAVSSEHRASQTNRPSGAKFARGSNGSTAAAGRMRGSRKSRSRT